MRAGFYAFALLRLRGFAPLRLYAAVAMAGLAAMPVPATAQAPAAAAPVAAPLAAHVEAAAARFGIPAAWIWAVMRVESGGDPAARSPAGAMGLMQIMPATWAELSRRHGLGANPWDPRMNILAGAAYLRELYDRYGAPGFLAAYNAGPGRYADWLARGRPLPGETRAYLARLAPLAGGATTSGRPVAAADPHGWTRAPIFVARAAGGGGDAGATSVDPPSVASPASVSPMPSALFVPRAPLPR